MSLTRFLAHAVDVITDVTMVSLSGVAIVGVLALIAPRKPAALTNRDRIRLAPAKSPMLTYWQQDPYFIPYEFLDKYPLN